MSKHENETTDEPKKMVKTYLTDDEHRQLRHAAAESEMNISEYVRDALMKAVRISNQEYLDRENEKSVFAEYLLRRSDTLLQSHLDNRGLELFGGLIDCMASQRSIENLPLSSGLSAIGLDSEDD